MNVIGDGYGDIKKDGGDAPKKGEAKPHAPQDPLRTAFSDLVGSTSSLSAYTVSFGARRRRLMDASARCPSIDIETSRYTRFSRNDAPGWTPALDASFSGDVTPASRRPSIL